MFARALKENNNDKITHTFLITINSNKAVKSVEAADELKNTILTGLRKLFSVFEEFVDIYKAGHYLQRKKASAPFSDICDNVKVNPQVEIGQEQKRIHSHIVVKWDSGPGFFFQINLQKLRRWVEQNMGPYHTNIRWIKGDSELFRYINKSQN